MSSIWLLFLAFVLHKSFVNGGIKEIVSPTGTTYEPDFTDHVQINNILIMAHDFLNLNTNALSRSLERFNAIHDMLEAIGVYFPNPAGKYDQVKHEFITLSSKFKLVIEIWENSAGDKPEIGAESSVKPETLSIGIQSLEIQITQCQQRIRETYKISELFYVYEYKTIYPFSAAVWQFFHVMTFSLYKDNPEGGDGAAVLKVVKGYALEIQGCIQWREHYAEITEGYDTKTFTAKESCILLWKFHNRVTDSIHESKKIKVSQLPTVDNIPIYFPVQKMVPSGCGLGLDQIPNEEAIFNWLYQMYTNIHV